MTPSFYSFAILMLLLLTGCSTRRDYDDLPAPSDVEQRLTQGHWYFRTVPPGQQLQDLSYSTYHQPPGNNALPADNYVMAFTPGHVVAYYPQHALEEVTWYLDPQGRELLVDKKRYSNRSAETWRIIECSDTLLNLQVRPATEPEGTENYWGFKYRR